MLYILKFSCVFLLVSCVAATPPIPPDYSKYNAPVTLIVKKDYNAVWDGLISFFFVNGYKLSKTDKMSGLIELSPQSVGIDSSEYCDCGIPGKPGTADGYISYKYKDMIMTLKLLIQEKDSNETVVNISNDFKCSMYGWNTDLRKVKLIESVCISTGYLENKIKQYFE